MPLPARTDDGEEVVLDDGFLQAVQYSLDHRRAAEEIGGVRLLKGAQTLVRILGLDQFKFGEVKLFQLDFHGGCPSAQRLLKLHHQRKRVFVSLAWIFGPWPAG